MTHYILTAAGDGVRWNNHCGIRKHLVPINGEPNLYRTLRLIHENDSDASFFVAHNPNYPITLSRVTSYDGTTYKKNAESDRYFASRPYWNKNGRTVLIWGDVFFTKPAIKTLCQPLASWARYGRPGGNKFKHYGEEFALSFNTEHHENMIKACEQIEDISLRTGTQLFGTIYLAMLGISENRILQESGSGMKNNFGHMIDICDETDDFDFPADYDKFIKEWKND